MSNHKPSETGKDEQKKSVAKADQKAAKDKPDPDKKSTVFTGKSIAIVISSILVIGVATAGYYVWDITKKSQQKLISQTDLNQSTLNDIQPKVRKLQTTTESLQNKINTTEQELNSVLTNNRALMDTIEHIQAETGKERSSDWVLSEAEYLMRIANNRLQLERDINTATAALMIADRRLQGLAQPQLLDVRRQLADEITALGSTTQPDISGISLTLSSLQDRVEQLPISGGKGEPSTMETSTVSGFTEDGVTENSKNWKELLTQVWEALKGLVTIRRNDQSDTPLLAPEQRDFLRLNMQLKLESARLALLKGNDQNYHDSLATAQTWLSRYFDPEATAVINMNKTLSELDQVNLDEELPDISGSLTALKKIVTQQPDQTMNHPDTDTAADKTSNTTDSVDDIAAESPAEIEQQANHEMTEDKPAAL